MSQGRRGFVMIPHAMREFARAQLAPSHRLVLYELAGDAQFESDPAVPLFGWNTTVAVDVGELLFSSRGFEKRHGLDRDVVRRSLDRLEALGVINRRRAIGHGCAAPRHAPAAAPPAAPRHAPAAAPPDPERNDSPPTLVRFLMWRELIWSAAPPHAPRVAPTLAPQDAPQAAPIQDRKTERQKRKQEAEDAPPPPPVSTRSQQPKSRFVEHLENEWPAIEDPHASERAWRITWPDLDLLAHALEARAYATATSKKLGNASAFLHKWLGRAAREASGANGAARAPRPAGSARTQRAHPDPIVEWLVSTWHLNRKRSRVGLYVRKWRVLFADLDLLAELKEASAVCVDTPGRKDDLLHQLQGWLEGVRDTRRGRRDVQSGNGALVAEPLRGKFHH
jgi:hypothetical protein